MARAPVGELHVYLTIDRCIQQIFDVLLFVYHAFYTTGLLAFFNSLSHPESLKRKSWIIQTSAQKTRRVPAVSYTLC